MGWLAGWLAGYPVGIRSRNARKIEKHIKLIER